MRAQQTGIALAALGACLALLAGCNDNISPGVEPEVVNETDNFEFQVTDVQNFSNTLLYTWRNTGTQADVNQATTLTRGAATLVIDDADGAEVYSKNLDANGTFQTEVGASGDWRIRVVIVDASGTLNFRVQKRQ